MADDDVKMSTAEVALPLERKLELLVRAKRRGMSLGAYLRFLIEAGLAVARGGEAGREGGE